MEVRPRLVDSNAGLTHHGDVLTSLNRLPGMDVDLAEMPVKTEIGRTIPAMLNHNVPSVVGTACRLAGVNHFSSRDRADVVQRVIPGVAIQAPNVDPFM